MKLEIVSYNIIRKTEELTQANGPDIKRLTCQTLHAVMKKNVNKGFQIFELHFICKTSII